ncbi:MAG TPA: hypothetical protein VMO26_12695 [Vicinamibacterales bacterium]|nr:hypothetical protein [Vicinamibacterales bacterium]
MSSGVSVTTYTWTCPDCGRKVPRSVHSCRCGHLASLTTLAGAGVHSDGDLTEFPTERAPPTQTTMPGGTVTISHEDVAAVAAEHGLTAADAVRLWNALCARGAGRPRFDAAHVAYYFGALVVISAMGFFMTLAWSAVGGIGLTALAAAYGVAFWMAGESLWRRELSTPGGLLFTMAVSMTPLAVYGIQDAVGIWPQGDPGAYREYYTHVRSSWIIIELATIGIGTAAIACRPVPFLSAPIAVALWFMSMDLTPLVFGAADYGWDSRLWVSVWFGLGMLLVAYWIDLKNSLRQDFAFWGYLFGLMAFWGGLSLLDSGSELSKFLYCLIHLALIVVSVLLRQRSFIVFGALGVLGYLGHLSYRVFEDSLLFPVALTLLGILVIYAGVLYQRNAAAIAVRIETNLPEKIRALVPPRARRV